MFAEVVISLSVLAAPAQFSTDKILKQKLEFEGKPRTYYLFVPHQENPDVPAPLILLFHGFVDGRGLTASWTSLAKQHGIILLAPNSQSENGWALRDDGPRFLHVLLEQVRAAHPVDPRRMYVVGVVYGGVHALAMAVLASEYFAAIATQGGVLMKELVPYIRSERRKIPIAMWTEKGDDLFPLRDVRVTRDVLNRHGFDVTLTELAGRPNYEKVDRAVWEFLRKHHLDSDPRFH